MKLTRPIIAWSLYDFADTSFSALFLSFFFPILVKKHLGGTEFHVGLAIGSSLLLTALLVPFIGAVSDAIGRRKPLLVATTAVTVVLTAFTGYAGLAPALILGFLANFFNAVDLDLYNSYLSDLAPREQRGRVSGFGTAVGYLGTIGSLAAAFLILSIFGFETKKGIQAMFPTVAVFYFIFSVPLFLWIKDRPAIKLPFRAAIPKAFAEIRHTLTHLRAYEGLGPFLLASFLYNDAMHTAIIFLSLFGTERIGLTIQQFFGVFVIMAMGAFAGSLLFGKLSDAWSPKRTLSSILALWMAIIAILLITKDWRTFILIGALGGALLGGIWTCNRHMLAIFAPPRKTAEIYGYGGLTEKAAGVLGPIGFGFLATRYGYDAGLAYLLLFFLFGFAILQRYVPERRM